MHSNAPKFLFIYILIYSPNCLGNFLDQLLSDNKEEDHWFPYTPGGSDDTAPSFEYGKQNRLYDEHHGIKMGIKDASCDDGQTNLEVDWDFSPLNYTCYAKARFLPRSDIQPLHSSFPIPTKYSAPHKCLSEVIEYQERIPTFGPHRPLWAKWGEYVFLPRQRWLHNLEHGGIALLYDPCADRNEVNILRTLVNKCLYRHVITPYNLLTEERPLALVSWGHTLEMSKVAPEVVVDFIRTHALNGAEKTSVDGQYDLMLVEHAEIVTDILDSQLCAAFAFMQ